MRETLKFLVIGCGSIGSRHISNLFALGMRDIVACDKDKNRLQQISRRFGIRELYTDFEKAISNNPSLQAAFVCTPTSLHLSMSKQLAKTGVDIFVEKPLAADLKGVDSLLRLVEKKKLILMVGMCYRFNPGIIKLRQLVTRGAIGKVYSARIVGGYYLPYWHPRSDYRKEYSARRALGGGVLLDGTHSLDMMRLIFGEAEKVACHYVKISDLDIDTEDLATFIFMLRGGTVVTIELNYLSRVYTNRIEATGEKGNLLWEFSKNLVGISRGGPWKITKYNFKINDMYLAELRHFIECIRRRQKPLIDGHEGKKILELVVAAKKSAKLGRFVKVRS